MGSKKLSDRPTSSAITNQQSSKTRPRGNRNNRLSKVQQKSNTIFRKPAKGAKLTIGIKNPTTERRNPFAQKNQQQIRPKHTSRVKVQRKRPGARRGQKASREQQARFKTKAFTNFGNGLKSNNNNNKQQTTN